MLAIVGKARIVVAYFEESTIESTIGVDDHQTNVPFKEVTVVKLMRLSANA